MKKECCDQCQDLSMYHWCPNKECGCFKTKKEQEAEILATQKACLHEDTAYGRCLDCLMPTQQKKRDGKSFFKAPKKKE